MTDPDPIAAEPPAAATPARRGVILVVLLVAFVLAAIVGAWLDWMWWPVTSGLVLTLAALPLGLIGLIAAAIGRGLVRRIGLIILVISVGLLVGQNLGPSRADLISGDGTLTLELDGPTPASGSGGASCNTVADGTEFSVSGDPNIQLDTADEPFVSVWFDRGDRWEALRSGPRADGTRLVITVTPRAVPDSGKPSTIGMGADETSTVVFESDGMTGTIRFADLVPLSGSDYTGESMILSGTIEFHVRGAGRGLTLRPPPDGIPGKEEGFLSGSVRQGRY